MESKKPRITRFYQFELRGFHALHLLGEDTHGHHCQLKIGITPLPDQDEGAFLSFIKTQILKDFDCKNWADTLQGEPSGENVLLEIGRRIQGSAGVRVKEIHLQETKKNLFSLSMRD